MPTTSPSPSTPAYGSPDPSTSPSMALPPPAAANAICVDGGNCSPRFLRPTLYSVPTTGFFSFFFLSFLLFSFLLIIIDFLFILFLSFTSSFSFLPHSISQFFFHKKQVIF